MIGAWSDEQMLDAVAGKIDASCQWRLQFWICGSRPCVLMLEGTESGAGIYLWELSFEQWKAIDRKDDVSALKTAPFALEEARELSLAQANYWRHWRFFRVGDVPEEIEVEERGGIWMRMRSFDGLVSHHANLMNPDRQLQPLRWQARSEVFELLCQIWDWQDSTYTSILKQGPNQ